ncbi:MAG: hypothetical protein ACRCU5_10560 [Rhizobiaceae bacterium]
MSASFANHARLVRAGRHGMRILIQSVFVVFMMMSSALPAAADCICLNRGEEVSEGKTACIKTAKGTELALCEKNLNVTNWKLLGEECPVAEMPRGSEDTEALVAQSTN